MFRPVLLVGLLTALFAVPGSPTDTASARHLGDVRGYPWRDRIVAARVEARGRAGTPGFAVINERGRLIGGYRIHRRYQSASVVKAMFMVCYLQRRNVRRRALLAWERQLLAPMIRRSDDAATNRLYPYIARGCLQRLARTSGMRGFSTGSVWGRTMITPAGTARLFHGIDRRIPRRHRAYGMRLLNTVIREQRWGMAQAVPRPFRIHFKGGFVGPPGDRIINQGATFRAGHGRGQRRFSVAILSERNPTHRYGTATLEQIFRRLIRNYHHYGH